MLRCFIVIIPLFTIITLSLHHYVRCIRRVQLYYRTIVYEIVSFTNKNTFPFFSFHLYLPSTGLFQEKYSSDFGTFSEYFV